MIAACVTGNLGRDAELNHTDSGALVVFSVASRRFAKGTEETDWVDVALWGKRAEALAKHLTKGTKIAARGALGVRKYTTKDGREGAALELRADDIELLGGGKAEDAHGGSRKAAQRRDAMAPAPPDEEIPFIAQAGDWWRP